MSKDNLNNCDINILLSRFAALIIILFLWLAVLDYALWAEKVRLYALKDAYTLIWIDKKLNGKINQFIPAAKANE